MGWEVDVSTGGIPYWNSVGIKLRNSVNLYSADFCEIVSFSMGYNMHTLGGG